MVAFLPISSYRLHMLSDMPQLSSDLPIYSCYLKHPLGRNTFYAQANGTFLHSTVYTFPNSFCDDHNQYAYEFSFIIRIKLVKNKAFTLSYNELNKS